MMKLLGFCHLAIVSGIGANFFTDLALANSLPGTFTGSDLTDAFLLSGGFGLNGALSTAVTANALGGAFGGDSNGLLTAAILAGGFGNNNNNVRPIRPAFDASGNYYYSSSYYVPPATTVLPPIYDTTYLPTTYLPTTYLPPTTYIPPVTTYLPTASLSSTIYPDYTTSYLPSPYVGLGVGSYGCWVNGVWMASCFV